ncbi:hypothetical protein BDP27DRAFT_1424927 [Rhodocollybia butyracea]|uniref:Uncharacterized protein n=1 Tax=Rhodocollybia butyracea TaxID=206335 RepID=A0A9P5PNP7_9AGAR|nr:hypothetical protein BDP27DRAFT_1424927 [Rhodocollybia butyracea]
MSVNSSITKNPNNPRQHGGKHANSGRKSKQPASHTPTPQPTSQPQRVITNSAQNTIRRAPEASFSIQVPTFFTSHVQANSSSNQPPLETSQNIPHIQNDSQTLGNDGYKHLSEGINTVMENDENAGVRVEQGHVIDESISDENNNDSVEENAAAAIAETENSEVVEHSVNHQWLLDYWNTLQREIHQYSMPNCYRQNQSIVYPPHPVFALHNASQAVFSPDPLCLRPIFVWLPMFLPGHPDHYKCECGGKLSMNGYNDNPIARHVRTSIGTNYFLFTNRFICDSCCINNRGCGTSYQGSDPHILAQLPRWVQEAFPGRFGPEPFSKMLSELQTLQHSRRELMYLSAAANYGLSGIDQVPPFPSFSDPMKYAGSAPSVYYIKCIWTDYYAAVKIFCDRVQASLSGFKLAGDHTFRIMKSMARLKSELIFGALFSLVNEWEEICAQAMTLTKGFSILPEMFKQVSTGLVEHSQQSTHLYYCDNPPAEREFHERVTESLKDQVKHIPSHPWKDFPVFQCSESTPVEFFDSSMLIDNACISITPGSDKIPFCTVRLRTSMKILIFKVSQPSSITIPACLPAVLTSSCIIKVGHDMAKIMDVISLTFSIPSLTCAESPHLDLGRLAKVKGVASDAFLPLSSLAPEVLKKKLPNTIYTLSLMTPVDILATEIDCIWKIYISLVQCNSVGLPLQPGTAQAGQLVTLVASRKEVAEGIILDHPGTIDVFMDENGTQKQLKITPAYYLIHIQKVLVPGSIVPKNSQSLHWIFNHGGKAVVQTRTLQTRNATLPIPLDPSSTLMLVIPAPPPSLHTNSDTVVPSTELLQEMLEKSDSDGYNTADLDDNKTAWKMAWLNRHARRYTPEPGKLEPALKQLFNSFKNIICSTNRKKGQGQFFSKELLQITTSLLDSVHCGFLSDPPGIPLYYIIGSDHDNLPLYQTIRGTNSIEGGVHMVIHHTFGSLRASPELTVSLLGNWTLRQNQWVGYFNRTWKKWTSHFDIWVNDDITELAVGLNVPPSFCLPQMLATRIATSESCGIIPLPPTLAMEYNILTLPKHCIEGLPHHRDNPAHLITHISTKTNSSYHYLQLMMQTIYPVIPVHTQAEYREFKHLVGLKMFQTQKA